MHVILLFRVVGHMIIFSLGQVNDDLLEDPFDNFRIGQTVTARIVAKTNYSDKNKKSFQWDLSLKPTLLTGKVISSIFFPGIGFIIFSFISCLNLLPAILSECVSSILT